MTNSFFLINFFITFFHIINGVNVKEFNSGLSRTVDVKENINLIDTSQISVLL